MVKATQALEAFSGQLLRVQACTEDYSDGRFGQLPGIMFLSQGVSQNV